MHANQKAISARSCYQLRDLYPAAAQDLTKYHSSIANVALHLPLLVPEDQLDFGRRTEAISAVIKISLSPLNLFLVYGILCVISKTT